MTDMDQLLDEGGMLKPEALMKLREFLRRNWLIKMSIIDAHDDDMAIDDLDEKQRAAKK